MGNFEKIEKTVRGRLQQKGLSKPLQAARVCELAGKVADTAFREEFTPISYKNGLLTLAVANSAIAQKLQWQSEKIIGAINKELGSEEVERIRFRVGSKENY